MSSFLVAAPARATWCNSYAQIFAEVGKLRAFCLGTRRGVPSVPRELTHLFPLIGLLAYGAAKTMSPYEAEAFRFRLHPLFDFWATRFLRPGDHVISSYGYANLAFRRARARGGQTFLDGGNSHPRQFWGIISEEHRRWKINLPPFAPHHYERSKRMMEDVDYVLSPSSYVTQSMLRYGLRSEQILPIHYPVDFSLFYPPPNPRPKERPFTIINTGSLSLRKGSPYLLEAFRLVQKEDPQARLLLIKIVESSMELILPQFQNLNIEWTLPLSPHDLGERLRQADIFVLPSLEEGLARTGLEALACGLPSIVTAHTGVNDMIRPGMNGEVVAIRSPEEIAQALLKWREVVMKPELRQPQIDPGLFSHAKLAEVLLGHLQRLGLL